jgi:hypothetical protein
LCNTHWKLSPTYNYGVSQAHERTWRRSFCDGCVDTIINRLKEAQRQVVQDENCTALVEVKDALLEAAVLKAYPDKAPMKTGTRLAVEGAYQLGRRAGYNVQMREELK